MQTLLGAILAAAAAAAAYRLHALTRSGAFGAFAVGTVAFAIGGWPAAAVLFAFFLPSALLSRLGLQRKSRLTDVGKAGARDAWQVVANGGVATVAIALSSRYGSPMLAAFAGAFAAAAADTWGTEIGTLARSAPRSILTFAPLDAGLSGGVTLQGSLAEAAGAAWVASVAALVHVAPFFPVFVGGVAGALVDSLLGASVQALRFCPSCARSCETNPHSCGKPTTLRRGLAWLENDAVNFAATASGAALAAAVFLF